MASDAALCPLGEHGHAVGCVGPTQGVCGYRRHHLGKSRRGTCCRVTEG